MKFKAIPLDGHFTYMGATFQRQGGITAKCIKGGDCHAAGHSYSFARDEEAEVKRVFTIEDFTQIHMSAGQLLNQFKKVNGLAVGVTVKVLKPKQIYVTGELAAWDNCVSHWNEAKDNVVGKQGTITGINEGFSGVMLARLDILPEETFFCGWLEKYNRPVFFENVVIGSKFKYASSTQGDSVWRKQGNGMSVCLTGAGIYKVGMNHRFKGQSQVEVIEMPKTQDEINSGPTEVLTPKEFDEVYGSKRIFGGDVVRLLKPHTNVALTTESQAYGRSGWTAEMDRLVGMHGVVHWTGTDYACRNAQMIEVEFATGLIHKVRAANCELLKKAQTAMRSLPLPTYVNIGTPFPIDNLVCAEPGVPKAPFDYTTVPRQIDLAPEQFIQRYADVDIRVGDKVVLLPHPLLIVNGKHLGTFAKHLFDAPEGVKKWFAQIVTVSEVSYSVYEGVGLSGGPGRFLRLSCDAVNKAIGGKKFWRAGDCVLLQTFDGKPRFGSPDIYKLYLQEKARGIKYELKAGQAAVEQVEQVLTQEETVELAPEKTLSECLLDDLKQKQQREHAEYLQRIVERDQPEPLPVPCKPTMTAADIRTPAHLVELFKSHREALEVVEAIEGRFITFGFATALQELPIRILELRKQQQAKP